MEVVISGSARNGRAKAKGLGKPAAGVGAVLGWVAMGPLGALLGATASTVAVKKDDLAGETVRTAAKAANAGIDAALMVLMLTVLDLGLSLWP